VQDCSGGAGVSDGVVFSADQLEVDIACTVDDVVDDAPVVALPSDVALDVASRRRLCQTSPSPV
jgi:hypothetical protein